MFNHLPRTQKRAGGGLFFTFSTTCCQPTSLARKSELEVVFFSRFRQRVTTSTSLARKSKPERVFFSRFTHMSPPPPPSHAKASRRWFFFSCFIRMSPPPPPSHAKVSRRWFFSRVSSACHHHHLPCMQKRARGGVSSPPSPRHHLRRPYPHTKHPTWRIVG